MSNYNGGHNYAIDPYELEKYDGPGSKPLDEDEAYERFRDEEESEAA